MMQIFLLNFLFLLFFLLFIPILIDQIHLPDKWKTGLKILSFSIAIISCISIPIKVEGGFILDLRLVATIIGGIYGGIPASIVLWLTNISYRSLFGGEGVETTVVLATVHMIFFVFLFPKLKKLTKTEKLLIGTVTGYFSSIFTIAYITIFYSPTVPFVVSITLILLQTTAVAIIIYFQELMGEMTIMKNEILRTEKMEIVSQLASSISHEVRNPLTVVKGFLQLMRDSNLPPEKRNEFLKISISELDRANSIIGDYLAFAKPSQERQENLCINVELEKTVEVITPLANMNSVTVKVHSISEELFIKGEKQLLQQCLLNITKNCIEAMPKGGELTLGITRNDNDILLHISDTGVGMSEEQLKKIGEPYFSTKGEAGTGLGMMTSLRIIQSMGGSLKITSQENKGTNFELCFPIVKK
ncbi:sensor histidine kinase [Evansella vedderi]|nr:HAMP domain-containing sensor histidine kinase [Evansella vedderi]